ncbi:MAG: flavodoxin-dependent (E)-4-hydroxy-3-methylbut-2-enyl-diphosphate synthase, partial [Spirochaetaceae bacterium]
MRDKKARAVKVKNLTIGGGFPVTVQTMWKKPLEPVSDLLI